MTDYLKTIFKLAEAEDMWSDEADDASLQEFDREKRVITLLTNAARKMGMDLAEISYPVQYSESDREATINIFEEVTLEQLQALTALGSAIRVSASPSHRDVTRIIFTVAQGMESANLSEARHGSVPSSMLANMKRWDAPHVLDVKDEVESRGGDITDAKATKSASDDLDFADRALPQRKPRPTPIRGIDKRKK